MAYKTIKNRACADFVERKSQFIGNIAPVKTSEEAVNFINEIRSQHRKATHNVYAYVLREGNTTRYSDDGEPSGTAGMPVLDVLLKEGLTDVCVVATRYFGGILLGGGGLVRVYSHTSKIAVEASEIMVMCNCFKFSAQMDYNLYGKVSYVLPDYDVKVTKTDFLDNVKMEFLVKSELSDKLSKKLTDICNGQISLCKSTEMCADFS